MLKTLNNGNNAAIIKVKNRSSQISKLTEEYIRNLRNTILRNRYCIKNIEDNINICCKTLLKIKQERII